MISIYDGDHLRGATSFGFQNYIAAIDEFIKNTSFSK